VAPELLVDAVPDEQLLVAPLLDDSPAVEHDEPVDPRDRQLARAADSLGSEQATQLVNAVHGLIIGGSAEVETELSWTARAGNGRVTEARDKRRTRSEDAAKERGEIPR
jgi:hypothetical protein